ncbi:hypothetical protein F4801DRAFT_512359 [Xylaria longipes]|nr:hypothetical protein F4801DRAFT_512359 [Xylaria longipes]
MATNPSFQPQNPSNTSKQVQTKIKKEKEDDGGNIASSPASPTADQNSSTRPAEPPQPKHSILPDIQLSRPGTRNRTGIHNSSLLKRSGLKIHKRRRRIVRTGPVPVRNNPEKEISADGQARLGHVSYHSSLRPVANIIPRLKSLINNEPQVKQGVSGSAHGTTSTGKRGPQDKSRNDDNEVAVAGETKIPLGLRSCDIALPSIEQHVDGTEIKAKTRAKTRSKTGKTITHDTGKTIGLGDKNKSTTHGTVVSSRVRRFKRGAMHDHNVSSFKDIDWAEQERRDEVDIKMMLNVNVDPRASEANLTQLSSFGDKVVDQTGKAEDAIDFEDMSDGDLASDPGSINALPGKDERQSLIKHSKNHIDNQCRGVQLVRELRQGVDQVSDDVFKKAEPNRRSSGIAAPIPSSAPPQTRTMTATNLLKSMLLPPPPSSNHAKTTVLSEGLLPPLLHTPADQTGRASIRRNEPVPSSTSKITNSRTANTNVSTGAVTHMTHTDKEKKAATKVATKRKSSKLSDALTGHPPHTHLPRPSKKPKTRDEREIINLVDSD